MVEVEIAAERTPAEGGRGEKPIEHEREVDAATGHGFRCIPQRGRGDKVDPRTFSGRAECRVDTRSV
jgi:hypothetical protein